MYAKSKLMRMILIILDNEKKGKKSEKRKKNSIFVMKCVEYEMFFAIFITPSILGFRSNQPITQRATGESRL